MVQKNQEGSVHLTMGQKNRTGNMHLILTALFLGYVMVYIDKLSVGISIVYISKSIEMSLSTKGLILSAFFIGYALMQIPMSFAINRFGARRVVISSIILIGLFDTAFSLSRTVEMLIIIRLLTGMFSHSGYASAASKEVMERFPIEKRTFAQGILISSSGVAGILGPIILSPIIELQGWRFAYVILTVLAIVIAVFVAFVTPKKETIKTNKEKKDKTDKKLILTVFKNPNIWILFAGDFFLNNLLYGIINWLPTYLTDYRNISLIQAGFISSGIGVFTLLGAILGGFIVSRFFFGKDKKVILGASIIGATFVFMAYFINSLTGFMIILGVATFFLTLTFVTLMAIPLKTFEGDAFAPSYSTIATGGIIGGAVTQIIIGFLVETSGTFLSAFIYFLCLGLLTGISILFFKEKKEKSSI